MFDYDLLHWTTFFTAAVLLTISPGPDMVYILGQTAARGRRAGLAACCGIWTGAAVHAIMAAVGLSAVLAASAIAFTVVKYLGAACLIWIGIQALRSSGDAFLRGGSGVGQSGGASFGPIYRQAVVIAVLNPKVAIFFLAFLPQFVVEGAGPIWAQLALHGALIVMVGAILEPPMVLIGAWLTRRVRESRSIGVWLDRSLGALFVGLGLRLAIAER